ncbi:MAG: hypothetical protein ACTS73_09360 [Arsenophonus sp. NEOnobi-MAG3]
MYPCRHVVPLTLIYYSEPYKVVSAMLRLKCLMSWGIFASPTGNMLQQLVASSLSETGKIREELLRWR